MGYVRESAAGTLSMGQFLAGELNLPTTCSTSWSFYRGRRLPKDTPMGNGFFLISKKGGSGSTFASVME
jgi:hypothetical protein